MMRVSATDLRQPHAALDQMTRDASEAGLYSRTAEDYATALKSVRRELAQPEDDS